GQNPEVIEPLAKEFIQSTICPRLSIRGGSVLSRHQREGHTIALISGSPEFLVLPLAETLGVSVVRAARLQTADHGYTGRVIAPLPYGPAKRRLLENLASQYNLDLKRSYAYGDSPGDFQALQAVGHPFVINPIRGMARMARQQGWPVSHWV
ncbi:MAG: HAD-IB family hydrolase, partial [Nitrospirales bacterium]|nr:HAD-IB family hydrolase [Nitrospirales bacterium]